MHVLLFAAFIACGLGCTTDKIQPVAEFESVTSCEAAKKTLLSDTSESVKYYCLQDATWPGR